MEGAFKGMMGEALQYDTTEVAGMDFLGSPSGAFIMQCFGISSWPSWASPVVHFGYSLGFLSGAFNMQRFGIFNWLSWASPGVHLKRSVLVLGWAFPQAFRTF